MSGLVLLDEKQQRLLLTDQRPAQPSLDAQYRRPPPTGRVPPPAEPRTDFTGYRNEYSANQGLPRTDFTTNGSSHGAASGGKPSVATNSSDDTDLADLSTARAAAYDAAHANDGRDSYPILRDDGIRESSIGSASGSSHVQYAGTSSGLHISVRFIMVGVVIGVALGLVFSELEVSTVVAHWVSLPGELFLRALKCLVVPYVLCSVAVAVGDIVFVGKVSVIGFQTAKILGCFWLSTVALGVSIALLFRPLFRLNTESVASTVNSIGFTCSNGLLLAAETNGSISCSSNTSVITGSTSFIMEDVNDVFVKNTATVLTKLSLGEQIMAMITPIVSDNIVSSMVNTDMLSIITFAMLLGTIAGRNYFIKTRRVNYLYLVLLQLRNTFFLLMEWTIWLSPVAVISIIAGSFATNQKSFSMFREAYPYLLAAILAALVQVFVLYPFIVFVLTRCNPYNHMRPMVRAYMFAFASSSSLATMPVTLSCIKKARVSSQSVAHFVISIGVVSSISGMGFYTPIALVFLAESSGNGDQLTALRIVGIFILSLLACSGTPPIPASGLVVISTAYTTLFGEIPSTFAYVVALDFILDRISTACNVNDDIMALKIISETTDETVAQDHLGQRF